MGEIRNAYNILVKDMMKGRDHLEDTGIDGKIILEWILRNRVGRCGLDSCGSG
jgi:hypothetical protein